MELTEIRVLILEDNPDDLLLLQETLKSSDEITIRASHSERLETALEICGTTPLDAAILDLNVPDSYGLETFLNFHKRFPLIPVVIMTGIDDMDLALKAVQHGAQDYLQKGVSSGPAVVRIVRYAIERQRLREELDRAKTDLQHSLEKSRERENEVSALLKGARAVLEQTDFETTARRVFDICSAVIGSCSGYVALLSDDGTENEVLFLEAGGMPCTVDPDLPMPIRGLRETAYRTNRTVYDNDFMHSQWMQFMPKGHVMLKNVMFAPLVIEGTTVGIMGLANKPGDFTENDARIASGFGELAAIALQNSRNLDKRSLAEKRNEDLIVDLRDALDSVKRLSGLLPICSHCKKIRDDKGYWRQIELYIDEHSEATFSHGICQECAKTHYPDMKIYED